MGASIPHLSVNGFKSNSEQILLKLFEYFLTSEYSQSNIYHGDIASLKYILQNEYEVNTIKNSISKTLDTMYRRYFDNVDVLVTMEESDSETSYIINITIIDSKNNTYKLNNSIATTENNITNMDKLMSDLRGM